MTRLSSHLPPYTVNDTNIDEQRSIQQVVGSVFVACRAIPRLHTDRIQHSTHGACDGCANVIECLLVPGSVRNRMG